MAKRNSTAKFVIDNDPGPLESEVLDLRGRTFDAFRECPVCGTGCRIIKIDVSWGRSTFGDKGAPVVASFSAQARVRTAKGQGLRGVVVTMRCCNNDEWVVWIKDCDRDGGTEPDVECAFKITRITGTEHDVIDNGYGTGVAFCRATRPRLEKDAE